MKKGTAAALCALPLILGPEQFFRACSGKAYLEGNPFEGERIVIVGDDNTLASIARDIADPEIFLFEPDRNAALANRNLLIKGTLYCGLRNPKSQTANAESEIGPAESVSPFQILEMNISRCGAVRIEVGASGGRGGELHLRQAKLIAIHETEEECSGSNTLLVRGKLVAYNSEISGNIGCVIVPGATVELMGSKVSYTQDSALSAYFGHRIPQSPIGNAKWGRFDVRHSTFIDNSNYGIRIGWCPEVLRISDSVFRGLVADVFKSGSGDLVLTDCDFKSVKFGSLSGRVLRKWSVMVEVPGVSRGLHIVARSAKGNPKREVVRGVSDEDGECRLVLTEYVASPPRAQEFKEGVNNVTPHEISVYDTDGKTLLYKIENFHVFMEGQKVSLQ